MLFLCAICVLTTGYGQTDSTQLQTMLDSIVGMGNRSYKDTAVLNQVAEFISDEFSKNSGHVYYQDFSIGSFTFRNVIGLIGDTTKPRIVIGAHYDVCGEQDGADDNGSGVVGLIASMQGLASYTGEYCLEFVAYTLEEPPFFGTEYMGSAQHANWLNERNVDVFGMISVEMIGFFSDAKKSQSYPLGILKLFYGGRGDYITLVQTFHRGKFAKRFSKAFKKSKKIKTKKFVGPKHLVGIDFSDHRNYWSLGYSALMITDTSFFRNKNYHQDTDTIDTLDFARMAHVVDGLVEAIKALGN